jgi:hypothetical protein
LCCRGYCWSSTTSGGPGPRLARAATGWRGMDMSGPQADITQRLQALLALNFRFATNHGTDGTVVALIGVRAHHGVIDIVALYGEHDADATRIPGDEVDILFPRAVLWRTTGSASRVIDTVLALPVPARGPAHSPHRNGSWMPTGPGRLVWLATDEPNGRARRSSRT